ncbi:MAG: DUF1846 domain-containing protein [Clostridia bacterium]|nr:DUF1846 domain-containing protein [Clostridia bacterium]
MTIGFDKEKYLWLQSQKIRERVDFFGGKLYIEFGGKLFDDLHAARVLPGFEHDSKLQMLLKIKEKAEIVIAINADDIEKQKIRGDLGITYDVDVLRLIDRFRSVGLYVGSVVLTRFRKQAKALGFEKKLAAQSIPVYHHYYIEGYPTDIEHILSEDGLGQNEYIQTSREVVVITAPGPGSGKMATCLSQIYHDHLHGFHSGYAKFETFPIWNLPLKHPLNIAYEAATADLDDMNMLDPFHMDAYGTLAVNYNRDVETFPVLSHIFERMFGTSPYKSPTDMGVNMAGLCIIDDMAVRAAAEQEIVRRYYQGLVDFKLGVCSQSTLTKLERLMQQAGLTEACRPIIAVARQKEIDSEGPACALMLGDGKILTGKTTSRLGPCAGAILNAVKYLAKIPDHVDLIAPVVIEPMQRLKVHNLGSSNPRLHSDEVLMALAICAATNPLAALALEQLDKLRGCEVHSSVILSPADTQTFKRLGMHLTCEPKYETACLYHK